MLGRFQSTSPNRENQISRYLTVQSRIEILIVFEFWGISRYKFKLRFLFNLNLQLTKISPPFRISITIEFSISSLIFRGTGCTTHMNEPWLAYRWILSHIGITCQHLCLVLCESWLICMWGDSVIRVTRLAQQPFCVTWLIYTCDTRNIYMSIYHPSHHKSPSPLLQMLTQVYR